MIRHGRVAWLALLIALAGTAGAQAAGQSGESLAGKLLIAQPSMPDPRFRETVIYLCKHARDGAFGLIVNRRVGQVPPEEIARQFALEAAHPGDKTIAVHWGGPVDPGRGFILHSGEYSSESTETTGPGVAFSIDTRILTDLVEGHGPARAILALGYAGWGAGQLEAELARDDWAVAPADPAFLFGDDVEHMWRDALARVEIEL